MSNRKPATASKHARSPKIAEKAQRAARAIVRGSPSRPVAAGSTELPPKRHNDSNQETRMVESPAVALQDNCKQALTDNDTKRGLDFSSATANVRTYQAKLLEMAQDNVQFAFELARRLAKIRSPVEFFGVIAEFTSKRIDMFRKYSKEMAELSIKR